jgi:hypothetical protein
VKSHITEKETLYIEGTRLYPKIVFNPGGKMKITGRIICDHLKEFFQPLFDWVENLECEEAMMEIKLDYLNSNGTFLLIELLRIMEANEKIRKITVYWFYEEDDEAHYELGDLVLRKLQRAQFHYMSYSC